MKMTEDFTIPLKVITARLNHLKNNFTGIVAEMLLYRIKLTDGGCFGFIFIKKYKQHQSYRA
ncbi:hypothetical protein HYG89_05285 [Acinetobacter sp. SwsAc5]|uniref:hypothetical protein n=1 Tax=Acinetobacter sp. SwsAc5 TaxID=2749438 RepID=UPI0015BA9529|nr:hypothetical protein [Acinetobacter sp. SwsAc5]NWK51981.1 hypothetical protein [Acinetobacter sp. SwsAc5]